MRVAGRVGVGCGWAHGRAQACSEVRPSNRDIAFVSIARWKTEGRNAGRVDHMMIRTLGVRDEPHDDDFAAWHPFTSEFFGHE